MTRYKVFWTVLVLLILVWVLYPSEKNESTTVRLTCIYGRVFIEFEEKYNNWGTMWLDTDGKPVQCHENGPYRGQVGSKITI